MYRNKTFICTTRRFPHFPVPVSQSVTTKDSLLPHLSKKQLTLISIVVVPNEFHFRLFSIKSSILEQYRFIHIVYIALNYLKK